MFFEILGIILNDVAFDMHTTFTWVRDQNTLYVATNDETTIDTIETLVNVNNLTSSYDQAVIEFTKGTSGNFEISKIVFGDNEVIDNADTVRYLVRDLNAEITYHAMCNQIVALT